VKQDWVVGPGRNTQHAQCEHTHTGKNMSNLNKVPAQFLCLHLTYTNQLWLLCSDYISCRTILPHGSVKTSMEKADPPRMTEKHKTVTGEMKPQILDKYGTPTPQWQMLRRCIFVHTTQLIVHKFSV